MSLPDDDHDPMEDLNEDGSWRDPDALSDGVPLRDWSALVDFITNNDTPEAHASTEARLKTDPAFAEFARPIIQLWKIPFGKSSEKRDIDAGWAKIIQRAAERWEAQSKLH